MSDYEKNKDLLCEINRAGGGIFFTPNPCSGGRREENITSIEWIYVDIDDMSKEEMRKLIKTSPIIPNIIVESKRSYHLYWRVNFYPINCGRDEQNIHQDPKSVFSQIIHGLIGYFHGDKAITSINEVLRFPDFFHMKDPKNPVEIKCIFQKLSEPIPASQMLSAYPYTPPKIEIKTVTSDDPILDRVKAIPIKEVLSALGIETKNNFILDKGVVTSASINESKNYINRFSGKEGSGSTIDACIVYGRMTIQQAMDWLKKFAHIQDVDKMISEKPSGDKIDSEDKMFTWGTENLDSKITPIEKDTFAIIVGHTGMGKTAYAFDMAVKNARLGHRVLYMSLEMSTDSILTRIARECACIGKERWRDKKLISPHQKELYRGKKSELLALANLIPMGFSTEAPPTVENIGEVIKKINPDLVFIDNFDLISKPNNFSEVKAETDAVNKILNLSKGLPKPIMLIHHMRKAGGKDRDVVASIDSMRGSGKIGHNADTVVIGHRAPYNDNMLPEDKAMFTITQIKDREFGIGGQSTIFFHKGSFYDKYQIPSYEIAQEIFN